MGGTTIKVPPQGRQGFNLVLRLNGNESALKENVMEIALS